MFTYRTIDLLHLDEETKSRFLPLLVNVDLKRIFIETPESHDKLIAVAAFKEDKPVGIAFGYAYPDIQQGFFRLLYVEKDFRKKGIGSALLLQLTEEFKKLKIQYVDWKFNSWENELEPLKRILQKQGWASPEIYVERYQFEAATFAPDWLFAEGPYLPKKQKTFLWKFLNRKAEEPLKRLVAPNTVLEDVSPFGSIYPVETLNSFGLRQGKEVIGWCITHRLDKDTIRYSAFYVHPEIRGLGPALCMLKESIRRHLEAKIKWGVTEINLKRTPKYWRNFVKKRLAPYASRVDYVLLTYKTL